MSSSVSFNNAKFPFNEPNLRISSWDVDPVSPDNSTRLIESSDFKGRNLRDLYLDMSVPLLVFTSRCYQEIEYLTHKFPHQEWAVFLTLKKLDGHRPHFLAFDWFMPGQKASSGAVSMQADDSIKYYDFLKNKYPYYKENGLHRFLCHLHSHHSMNMPEFSSVDKNQQSARDELGFYDAYRFYVVVTCHAGIKASFVQYDPAMITTPAAVAITWSEPEYVEALTPARKKEIDAIVDGAMYKAPVKEKVEPKIASWCGRKDRLNTWQKEEDAWPMFEYPDANYAVRRFYSDRLRDLEAISDCYDGYAEEDCVGEAMDSEAYAEGALLKQAEAEAAAE